MSVPSSRIPPSGSSPGPSVPPVGIDPRQPFAVFVERYFTRQDLPSGRTRLCLRDYPKDHPVLYVELPSLDFAMLAPLPSLPSLLADADLETFAVFRTDWRMTHAWSESFCLAAADWLIRRPGAMDRLLAKAPDHVRLVSPELLTCCFAQQAEILYAVFDTRLQARNLPPADSFRN